jgi:hypothetical protein
MAAFLQKQKLCKAEGDGLRTCVYQVRHDNLHQDLHHTWKVGVYTTFNVGHCINHHIITFNGFAHFSLANIGIIDGASNYEATCYYIQEGDRSVVLYS